MTPAAWIALASFGVTVGVLLGGIIFNLGKLSERVSNLENSSDGAQNTREKLIQVETKLDGLTDRFKETTDRQARTMDNMSRQLASIASKGLGFGTAAE